MKQPAITKATLGRLPIYLQYIKSSVQSETVSATTISKALGLGEVQVRKDLNLICEEGKPKIGYQTERLVSDLEKALGVHNKVPAVIVGAGKLGLALQGYDGFLEYGLEILASFDSDSEKRNMQYSGKTIFPMEQFTHYCQMHDVHIGILTVPAASAQSVCDKMVQSGITAIWNFAPCTLKVPENVIVQQENLALSLAHLNLLANHKL